MKRVTLIIFFVIVFSIFCSLLPIGRSENANKLSAQLIQRQRNLTPIETTPQGNPNNFFAPTVQGTQQLPSQLPSKPSTLPSQPSPQQPVQPQQAQPPTPVPQPSPPPAKPPVAKKGEVSFNFDDADIYSVIQTIFGDVLRVNYIVDPTVKGRVTFRSVAPIAKEDVLPLMEVILRLNGIGIVEEGGLYRIVPIADIPKEPAPVGIGRDPERVEIKGKALLQVVPIFYIQSSEMVRILTPFLSKNAVIVDVPKINYIVIVDTDANVKRLLQLVEVFDSEQLKKVTPKVFVYPVQNSKAKDVASMLQQIFLGAKPAAAPKPAVTAPRAPGQPLQPGAATQPQVPAGAEAAEAIVSEMTRIFADEVTNSIIILATPEDYEIIADTIKKIDIVPRQVLIEALVVRVQLTDNLSFGFSWSLKTDVNITNIKPFDRDINLDGDIKINPGGLDTTKLPSKGFTFVGKDPTGNVRAVLTALAEEAKAKILAAPHVLVSDNREARIQVGSQVPVATSTTTTTAQAGQIPSITTTIQYKDIGIILKVKPQVNDSGLVSLEIAQEVSSLGTPVSLSIGTSDITIDKTEATTSLVVQDGQTIIIGGLIREDITKSKEGIPLLSKIPIIGNLFGTTTDNMTRSELIILLTPHVMRSPEEAVDVTSGYVNRFKSATKDKKIDEFIKEREQKEQESGTESKEPKSETP
ncbi:MAG: secretin N-terminal domain-containing protein [Nitrospirota bacterium]